VLGLPRAGVSCSSPAISRHHALSTSPTKLSLSPSLPAKQYAKHKVWVKPAAEMSFLYGNHVLKAGVGRVTDGVQQHCGVVVVNMADVGHRLPLAFPKLASFQLLSVL
jgi:hypothetical protein